VNQRKPWLPTAILAGVAVLLAAFAIWIVPLLGKPSESDNVQPTPIAFFEFGGGDIVRISVTKGFLMTAVERTGAEWRVTAPTPSEANNERLNDLVFRIADMRSTRALEGIDPADFGLKEPTAQVTIGLKDGTTVSLTIGDENPGATGRYVQVQGDARVHLVPGEYVNGLIELVDNPPYPATPVPPPSPVETPTPGESPEGTPGTETTTPAAEVTTTPEASTTETPTSESEEPTPSEVEETETPEDEETETPTSEPRPTPTPGS
jgi:hypothetical protein